MTNFDSYFDPFDQDQMAKLADLVRRLNSTGHNPATSGNYSLRSRTSQEFALVSQSGIDKSQFQAEHFIPVMYSTGEIHDSFKRPGLKSSDETDLHLAILQSTDAGCVLHSHFLESLLFADLFPQNEFATLENLELLKGLKSINTHEASVRIPLFENTQDIRNLGEKVRPILKAAQNDRDVYSLILRGHGIYVWGSTVQDAKRHLEVFEYCFKYYLTKKR